MRPAVMETGSMHSLNDHIEHHDTPLPTPPDEKRAATVKRLSYVFGYLYCMFLILLALVILFKTAIADKSWSPTSCPSVLKRQIAFDIEAETSPAHKEAFGTCLPQRMKHIPPNNDTEKMWHSLVIPEDLKTMSAVWDDISHLTSTKAFHAWLQKRPHLPMAKYLKSLDTPGDKKQAFVVPSDYVLAKEGNAAGSAQELALPVSEFTLELKEVLNELMND